MQVLVVRFLWPYVNLIYRAQYTKHSVINGRNKTLQIETSCISPVVDTLHCEVTLCDVIITKNLIKYKINVMINVQDTKIYVLHRKGVVPCYKH